MSASAAPGPVPAFVTGLPGIVPAWPLPRPAGVGAFSTTRAGGVSAGRFGTADGAARGLNLGGHVGDDPEAVRLNRARVAARLPGDVVWLTQVHGTAVHDADAARTADDAHRGPDAARGDIGSAQHTHGSDDPGPGGAPEADAAVTAQRGTVLAIMTADCLPVLLADAQGRMVGAAHAGWRGLANGVIEATVDAMRARLGRDATLLAWLGPAIGPSSFEVGDEVRAAFCDPDASAAAAFAPGAAPGKWLADLYLLARLRLLAGGVRAVSGGDRCTVLEPQHFYSHRRDRGSGRMASFVWLAG